MAEETDPGIKNILSALTVAAPRFVKARALNEKKFNETQIVENIVGAVDVVRQAREQGTAVEGVLAQTLLFDQRIPEVSKKIALFIDENKRSAKRQGSC